MQPMTQDGSAVSTIGSLASRNKIGDAFLAALARSTRIVLCRCGWRLRSYFASRSCTRAMPLLRYGAVALWAN